MKKVEPEFTKKEKVLQMLASLSPIARKAVLLAALEVKASRTEIQKLKDQEGKY